MLGTPSNNPPRFAALWRHIRPGDRSHGERLANQVDGQVDPYGGIQVRVGGARGRNVALAIDVSDPTLLLAGCECAPARACEHISATLVAIERQRAWPTAVRIPSGLEVVALTDPSLDLITDGKTAVRPDAASATRTDWRDLVERWPASALPEAGKVVAIEYVLQVPSVRTAVDELSCHIRVAKCVHGKGVTQRRIVEFEPRHLSTEDREIQRMLFGIEAARGRWSGALDRSMLRIDESILATVLPRLAATGRFGTLAGANAPLRRLDFDARGPWRLRVELRGTSAQHAAMTGELVRGAESMPLSQIDQYIGGGLVIAGTTLLAVAVDRLGWWLELLADPIVLPRREIPNLIARTCTSLRAPEIAVVDVGIEVVDAPPIRRIILEPRGRGGFSAAAELAYGSAVVTASTPRALVDKRGTRLVRRRFADEHAAALAVRELGGAMDRPWNVAPSQLRTLVERAGQRQFEVLYRGARVRTGEFSAIVASGIDWFDVSLQVDSAADTGAHDVPELLAALRKGQPLVRLADGTSVMIPPWLERRAAAFAAATQDGKLRFKRAETLLLATLLDTPELKVEHDAAFAKLRTRLDQLGGMAPRDAPRGFQASLREYQREGLGWLHFLRELGLGGCLADDMGLGKTVQVLGILEQARASRVRKRKPHRPSLVVAPRSLVFHWIDEARRFAPKLTTLEWHGKERAERAAELERADLVVTTYATLRLDRERFTRLDFDTVILDEAHAIKNADTSTAAVVRELRADHRLALTGTPVENRLEDLASIFEFLNPGLLGRPGVLRALDGTPELVAPTADDPVREQAQVQTQAQSQPHDQAQSQPHDQAQAQAQARAQLAQARALGRVLRPFMLRRTKQQVLPELPAKTEIEITCRLEGAERRRYDELRDHYRRALLPVVERDGMGRNAIIVLEALLRLRQAALHPGLLDASKGGEDSAKLDALVEHLREATASGHRALVFSQFTTLLGIVRDRLAREGIGHEYLDGQTRDRRERVAAFQTGSAPVFLLSLKAGGTGLNLTAADHVFLLDPWWNPAIEAQAIDRIHRIGQGRPVTAYRLVAADTVEAKILALQAHKRALFDNVFADQGVVASMSTADLRALLD